MQPQQPSQKSRHLLWIGLLLFFITFAFFSRVLVADFTNWDDDQSVYRNPHVQGLDWERVRWMLTDVSQEVRYKPLTWLCYGLIYEIGGLNPFGYHLVSLLLHSVNAALVFVVIRRLLALVQSLPGSDGEAATEEVTVPAAVGALLWALNPLRVEPVTRVSDMTYCLSFFFLLISLWCYLQTPGMAGGRFHRFYWCSVTAFALSMLSYPFPFGYVVVLAVLDWYPLRRVNWFTRWWQNDATRRVGLQKLPFLLLGGLVCATLFARLKPTGIWADLPSASGVNVIKQGIQAAYLCVYYGWKSWLPLGLSPVYDRLIWFNPREWPFWSSTLLAGGVALLLWWKRREWPWAVAAALIYVTFLLAGLGLTERAHQPFDRYGYMAGTVWAVLVAAALWKLSARGKARAFAVTAALAVGLVWGGLSFHQIRIWKNSEVLLTYALAGLQHNRPFSSILHGYLGNYYVERGRVPEAIAEYQTSLSLQPSAAGYAQLGMLLETNGVVDGALTNYLKLLEIGPSAEAHARAAQLFLQSGQTSLAIEHYRQAVELAPESVSVLNNLAWILATAPDASNRNAVEAVDLAERACRLTEFKVPVLVGTLGAAYAEAGRFAEAVQQGESAAAQAEIAGDAELAQRNRKLVQVYRAGRAWHEGRADP